LLADILGLQTVDESPYLVVGTAVHSALERMYKGEPWEEWYDADIRKAMLNPTPALEKRSRLGRIAIEEYAKYYGGETLPGHTWIPLASELAVKVPVPEVPDAFVTGRIDLLVFDQMSQSLVIVDHKTTSDFSNYDDTSVSRDLQFRTYDWIASKLWPDMSARVVVDVLRLKEPVDPVVLPSGKISRDRQIATTPERVMRVIQERGLDPAEYANYLHDLKVNSSFFARKIVNVQERSNAVALTEQHLRHMIAHARIVEGQHEIAVKSGTPSIGIPNAMRACEWDCDFSVACFLMEASGDLRLSTYSNLLKKSEWNNSGKRDYVTPLNAAERLKQWLETPLPGF
jgi:hypothetical protein